MATHTTTIVTSDLSGSADAETVTIGLNGLSVEVDLTAEEKAELESLLKPYLDAGRRVGRATSTSRTRSAGRTSTGGTPEYVDPKSVRSWAGVYGIDVPAQGRIPKALVARYLDDSGEPLTPVKGVDATEHKRVDEARSRAQAAHRAATR